MVKALFRKYVYEILKKLIKNEQNIVIATGGGAPCTRNAMQLINEGNLSVYLKLSEKSIFQRLKQGKKRRPLTDSKSDEELLAYIQETLTSRELFYNQAHLHIKAENLNVKELSLQILKFIKEQEE